MMIKIGDIAKATGYSVTTVSKAFNNYTDISEKARNTILAKADELGYIPNAQARGLVMKRSFTIGVMLDEILGLGLTHPFFAGVVQAFREVVEERGYSMILISNQIGNSLIGSYLDHCKQRNVDGVFILCTNTDDEGIQALIHSDIPTVLFDIPDGDTHSVISNHYEGALEAVNYLIDKGHRKIAHIYGNTLTFAGAERKRGYMDVLNQHHIKVLDEYLVCGGYFDFKYGKKAMVELLALETPPTAVFVSGDIMALGAIQACYERHIRVPEDLSIIGFDNVKLLDWITPALTTVAQDYKEIGKACCDILLKAISDKKLPPIQKIISTHMIKRNSCASIK
ncbi:LacI family DNA-binding transcriptional regulator [Vallitalea pronyensis]|uniref:LacI family DNA-binding transcriptional regulator n=1 Tax=Vallitalea pronyensis TaxID=1348613 RepID=A0A8J8MMS9_9FIRM|nr:LacI family DNA-binding transcriptional regulator [Vallitalea pronyensis]QUI24635.1 LacI family DNA-binding transcriptional regulator [Vallitalea pronyensis]